MSNPCRGKSGPQALGHIGVSVSCLERSRKKETLLVSFIFGSPFLWMVYSLCFLCGSDGEESVCSAVDTGLLLGLGRCPGDGNGNPLQYSCLENSMDRGACWATVHGITKSQTQLSDYTCMLSCFYHLWGLPGGASGKEPACSCRRHKRCGFES